MDEAGPPNDNLPGRLLAASMLFLLAAVGLRAATALNDGWALLYASISCGAVALTCLGGAVWRNRDRL